MDHLTVANFKFGLDTRRSELTSQPGTLVTAENGHINQGAQFEKRKAFVLLGTLPAGTFGLQETPNGLVTFGSGANAVIPGGLLNLVTYQRLRHWLWALDEAAPQLTSSVGSTNHLNPDWPNPTFEPSMTGLTLSCTFGGKAVAVASFSQEGGAGFGAFNPTNPITLCFFDGQPITSSFQGLLPFSNTGNVSGPAANFWQAIWLAYVGKFYLGDTFSVSLSTGPGTNFTGPLASTFDIVVSDTVGGQITSTTLVQNSVPVQAVGAFVTIYFTKGAAGSINTLTAANVVNGAISGTLDLLNGATVNYNTSLLQTATDLATKINNGTTGYTAQAGLVTVDVASITITAPLAFGAVVNTGVVAINTTTIFTNDTPDKGTGAAGSKNYTLDHGVTSSAGNGQVQTINFQHEQLAQGTYQCDLVFNNETTTLGAGFLTTKRASFVFFLTSGASGSVDSIVLANGLSLLSAAVPYNTSLQQTSIDIVSNLNTKWGGGGFNPPHPESWAAYYIEVNGMFGVVVQAPMTAGESLNGTNNVTISCTTLQIASVSTNIGQGVVKLITSLDGGSVDPTCATSLGGKLYFGRGKIINFSASFDGTRYEQQDIGAGFIQNTDQDTSPSATVALCPYQGKLAAFSRRNISIWNVNADPAQYSIMQNLKNIGTMASLSVQPIGELDTLFLSDTGIRSLRTRDTTLNAYVVDVGSPIDSLIQTALLAGNGSSACSIVEPSSNRYWLYINGTIYVLSYFPSLKIVAWSTYLPTYDDGAGNQVTFTPSKFLVYNGQVYIYTTDRKVLVYGGANNNTYDGCVATIELPWLDAKSPFMIKQGDAVNVAMQGKWDVYCALDPRGNSLVKVVPNTANGTGNELLDSTFDEGSFPIQSQQGTHYKFKAQTTPDWKQPATMSSFTLQYSKGEMQ